MILLEHFEDGEGYSENIALQQNKLKLCLHAERLSVVGLRILARGKNDMKYNS